MGSFRDKWIPRLFILAIAPSVAMVIALLLYPETSSKCPLFVDQSFSNQFVMTVNSGKFGINNSNVVPLPLPAGEYLVFLGIVLDVRSGAAFYGKEGGYSALANGRDSTRALLTSSLKDEDMTEDIDDVIEKFENQLHQWLIFFLNKYPQIGVVQGKYWDAQGKPTAVMETIVAKLGEAKEKPSVKPFAMDACRTSNNTVSCTNPILVPKIRRSRGQSSCVCVNENEIFAVKTTDFVVVHFTECQDRGKVCHIQPFEL